MAGESTQPRYEHPGKISDYESGELLIKSRMFVGDCTSNLKNSALWFTETKVGQKWKKSVFVVNVESDSLHSFELKDPLPAIDEAIKSSKTNLCKEIAALNTTTEP